MQNKKSRSPIIVSSHNVHLDSDYVQWIFSFLSLLFYPLIDKFRRNRELQKNLRDLTGSEVHKNVV